MKKLLIGILLTAGLAHGQTVLITEPVSDTDTVVVYPKLATSADTYSKAEADTLLAGKVDATDGVATNLTIVSTTLIKHAATNIDVAKFVTLTNGIALYVWKASITNWVLQTEWTED